MEQMLQEEDFPLHVTKFPNTAGTYVCTYNQITFLKEKKKNAMSVI